ncbi:MAG: low molecular weight phosphatase family protein [Ekhidna sp.]
MYHELEEYISSAKESFGTITDERKAVLNAIINDFRSREHLNLNFICTHNSRRSHLSQIWAQTAADYYKIPVDTYSGGTEATAFHPNAIAALKRAGFQVNSPEGKNPPHEIKATFEGEPMICFSKCFDEAPNPKNDFIAIMTCSEADQGCPVVAGATNKIQLLYDDPKVADGTPNEAAKYDERCKQIATEMFYVFSQLK